MLTKLFGQSRLQEEFKKSILLKLQLLIDSISEIVVSQNQNSIIIKNSLTSIHFDFKQNTLIIKGDSFAHILNENYFMIARIDDHAEPCEIFLSNFYNTDIIIMKFSIYRNSILIEGTLSNWHCKISNDVNISH
jgi:hypothetical protein